MTASIALVAHDEMKDKMLAWAGRNKDSLATFTLFATGTTGGRLVETHGLEITRLKSGPLGGDAQLGAMISEGRLEALIFFIDPLSSQPHDVDVKSLLRLAILYDTALAVNERTADAVLAGLKAGGS
jgi:methylglyoxal synthase